MALPPELRQLFWDCDFETLDPEKHSSFIIRRILERGDWSAILWLRQTAGDDLIREWFLAKRGRGLDPRKLRFWGFLLNLPKSDVDQWVRRERASLWHGTAAG